MTEFLVVIPVFLLLLLNIISFGPFLNVYLTTAHLAHEGARMLSNTPELTPNTRVTTVWQFGPGNPVICHQDQGGLGFPACDSSVAAIPSTHQQIHERMLVLINALRLANAFSDNQVGVVSNYSNGNDNVIFTIYGRYQGLAGFLLGNVVVAEEGPYLY